MSKHISNFLALQFLGGFIMCLEKCFISGYQCFFIIHFKIVILIHYKIYFVNQSQYNFVRNLKQIPSQEATREVTPGFVDHKWRVRLLTILLQSFLSEKDVFLPSNFLLTSNEPT